ncbi:hypothetical protein TWF481_002393 [Arthrobotrys musiformis]|uniref:Uncharacterized protein n=1 Tax=Arthrobotrys musiformis TaxID=47236 RepID=A0AAV9VUP0_9PEZI
MQRQRTQDSKESAAEYGELRTRNRTQAQSRSISPCPSVEGRWFEQQSTSETAAYGTYPSTSTTGTTSSGAYDYKPTEDVHTHNTVPESAGLEHRSPAAPSNTSRALKQQRRQVPQKKAKPAKPRSDDERPERRRRRGHQPPVKPWAGGSSPLEAPSAGLDQEYCIGDPTRSKPRYDNETLESLAKLEPDSWAAYLPGPRKGYGETPI